MATKEQYDVFKLIYDEERERFKELIERAKIFLSLTVLYTGFLAFTIEKNPPNSVHLYWLFIAAVIAFLASFLFTVLAMGIYRYEGIRDPEQIIAGYGEIEPDNGQFFDHRIGDFTVACNRNWRKNNIRARLLLCAVVAILAGLSLHATYFLLSAKPGGL